MVTDELYDLESDPHEMNNLINSAEHAAIRNSLHDRLMDWMDDTRDPLRGYYWGQRPWRPEFIATWHGKGMMRNDEFDGYLPLELVYETGLEITQVVYGKPGGGKPSQLPEANNPRSTIGDSIMNARRSFLRGASAAAGCLALPGFSGFDLLASEGASDVPPAKAGRTVSGPSSMASP